MGENKIRGFFDISILILYRWVGFTEKNDFISKKKLIKLIARSIWKF